MFACKGFTLLFCMAVLIKSGWPLEVSRKTSNQVGIEVPRLFTLVNVLRYLESKSSDNNTNTNDEGVNDGSSVHYSARREGETKSVEDELDDGGSASLGVKKRHFLRRPNWIRYRTRGYRYFRSQAEYNNAWQPRFVKDTFLFGYDDRSKISQDALRKYPYYNIVRLSSGCTGTLVSPRHILTAAHCIRGGGKSYKSGGTLKIEIPDIMGSRMFYARKAMIPYQWMKSRGTKGNIARAVNDFAIVELNSRISGRWHFLQFDWTTDPLNKAIQFYSYPVDRYPEMWGSTCQVEYQAKSLLLNRCDAASGSSGSAAMMQSKNNGIRLVGIVSGVINNHGRVRHFNAISRLTLSKLWDICDMIGNADNMYVCSDPRLRLRPRRYKRYFVFYLV